VPVAALERMEDGGELFREREEPAVGGRLLIAQSIDKAAGCETSAGDAGGEPRLVDLSKEAGDLAPAGSLARFAGIAYEDEKEVQTVAGGIHHAVGSAANQVAEDGQKLEENGGGMRLSVERWCGRRVPRSHGERPRGAWANLDRGAAVARWKQVLPAPLAGCLADVKREAVQLSPAALYLRKV
jgi:hypothetical protein